MFSKEEIEDKKYIIKTLNRMKIDDTEKFMKAVSNVIVEDTRKIKQLETKEQKVIKFLVECKKEYIEELKYNCTKRDARLQLQLVDMILEIMKGEKC